MRSCSQDKPIILSVGSSIKTVRLALIMFLIPLAISCAKNGHLTGRSGSAGPLITACGDPDGLPVTKTIGTNGGSITSADGIINIVIPSGALTDEQAITVQPVTRQLPEGFGKVYRLTPHDIVFQQPVTISMKYTDAEIKNTKPELLGMVYQDQSGKWLFSNEPDIDKEHHTLSTTATHFSDWGYFPYFYISPSEAQVEPGARLELSVMATVPDEFASFPLPGGSPVLQSYQPDAAYLGAWTYSGTGVLKGNGNKAIYTAPDQVPDANPEAVSIPVKIQRKGQFMLVSNISVGSGLHIDYMQVDETERHQDGLDYESRLWIYGSFGEDPGEKKRSVKIAGVPARVALWRPGWIACDIPVSGPGSDGMVEVTSGTEAASKMLNYWVATLHYAKVESPDGALTKKIDFILRFRGDARSTLPADKEIMVEETDLNKNSLAAIDMPSGSYTSHTTLEGCTDYTVSWDAIEDLKIWRTRDTEPGAFNGRVIPQKDGFDIKLRFLAENALMSHRGFADCSGGGSTDNVPESVELQHFKETIIPLRFEQSGNVTILKPGEMPLIKSTGVAAGLYFDVTDYTPGKFSTRLYWNEARPGM